MRSAKKPKAPPPATAEETALVQRQQRQLDQETRKSEKSFKALARGKLGAKSLLGGGAEVMKKKKEGPRV